MSVLLKPIVTEKTNRESELYNRYSFSVDPRANKLQVKEAVEHAYGVSVIKVRTMIYGPERRTRYTKKGIQYSKTNAMKKAIVELAEGDSIDFYSNI